MARLKLSSPWIIYYQELSALFKYDDSVKIVLDEDEHEIHIYVDSQKKANALSMLIPDELIFGNIILKISIIPSNTLKETNNKNIKSIFENAFENNPAFRYVTVVSGFLTNDITYVVFKKEIVQYFNDNIGDINGICSTLYQDIAKNVFKDINGVFYCTDYYKSDIVTF